MNDIFEVGRVYVILDKDVDANVFVDNYGNEQGFIFHGDRSELLDEVPSGTRELLCVNYDIPGNDFYRISVFENLKYAPKKYELFENESSKVIGYFDTLDEIFSYIKKHDSNKGGERGK